MNAHRVPPSPEVLASLYEEYLRNGQPRGLTFEQYLISIGLTNESHDNHGQDDGARLVVGPEGPALVSVPQQAVVGNLAVKVLLIDFPDLAGTTPREHYENLLFSKGTHPTGSMRDYFDEVSLGKVDVQGSVDGWIRLPRNYSYYTNGQSGTGRFAYPRDARRMAEHAVQAALDEGVVFDASLNALNTGTVTALFLIHAGVGAEVQTSTAARNNNIWSHKWGMPNPVDVGGGLIADVYLTVPHDARLGVCAHELGHLAFQWEDFYDSNYAEDGKAWDGSGDWDLMAGGSYNGNSHKPAHPVSMHKAQHGWIDLQEITASTRLTLQPFTARSGEAARVRSSKYTRSQYLLLENRSRFGFDSHLPGEGLLVWRVDESKAQVAPDRPALLLVEADGRQDLQRVRDSNAGDSSDPFPGTANRTSLSDSGRVSTSFPQGDRSGIELAGIERNAATGAVTLDVIIDGLPIDGDNPPVTGLRRIEAVTAPDAAIPDNQAAGIESVIDVNESGALRDIAVGVEIEHSYRGDLIVEIESPQGQSVRLHDMAGAGAANLNQTYRTAETPALTALLDAPVRGSWTLRVSDRLRADTGRLKQWGLVLDVENESRRVDVTREPALDIPDDDPVGVSDAVDVPNGGIVRALEVDVDISHSYRGDLRVELAGPNGEVALLHNRTGGRDHDLEQTFTAAQAPQLSRFVTRPVAGAWALRVSDHAGQDVGVLNRWRLAIELAPRLATLALEESPGTLIPDNQIGGIGRSFRVSQSGTVQHLRVRAAIRHSYIGDLEVELVAPSGDRALLHRRTGGRARDLILDLESSTAPLLEPLVGQSLTGNWILRVADRERFDEGTFESWALDFTYLEG